MGVAAVVIIPQAGVAEQVVRAGPVQIEFLGILGYAEFIVAVPRRYAAVLAFQAYDASQCIAQVVERLRCAVRVRTAGAFCRLPVVARIAADPVGHADPFFTCAVHIRLLPALAGISCGHQGLRNTHGDVIGKVNIQLTLLVL
ncbi:hypothetical protein D3C72_1788430 [compost metagenome]